MHFIVQNKGWNEKDGNRETERAWDFLIVFILCVKYVILQMITKSLKGYVPHLHICIKYKSITVCIKNKKGKDLFNLNSSYIQNKQNQLRQTKMNDIK